MVSVLIAAGGKGTRMGAGYNKIFMKLAGREIVARTLDVFNSVKAVDEIIIVTATEDMPKMQEIVARDKIAKVSVITEGGIQRQDSVYNGLMPVKGDIVLIHDAARCLVTPAEIENVIEDTIKYGAAATGVAIKDTLKTIDDMNNIISTVDREKTIRIQTPQGFRTSEIIEAHNKIKEDGIPVTDDCSAFEYCGKTVHVTAGSYENIKITTPEDIAVGEEILSRRERQ